MYQLKYDKDFTHLIRDIPYWKTEEDIPQSVIEGITRDLEKNLIYDIETNKFYCVQCKKELDQEYYCKDCQTSYKNKVETQKWNRIADIKKEYFWQKEYRYFVFDIVDHDAILYLINININNYYNPYLEEIFKKYHWEVESALLVEKDRLFDLPREIEYTYQEYYEKIYQKEEDPFEERSEKSPYQELEDLFNIHGELYTDNLEELKNTIYRYSYLWNIKEYTDREDRVTIEEIVFLPLYFPQFEYLMKQKLYALVITSPRVFKKGKSFQETFGVDKKYLPFIKKYNMTWDEVSFLQRYPTNDIEVIRFFTYCYYLDDGYLDLIKEHKIDLKELKDHLKKEGLSVEYLSEYIDYLLMAIQLKLDLKDKKILYPENLLQRHDQLYLEIKVAKDPTMNSTIKNRSPLLALNKYEDGEYVIYPAGSIDELIEESTMQHNCVRTYCEKVAKNECQIYFMRKKTEPKESFVTIEVRENSIIQARTKYNALPNDEIKKILKRWEKSLISVVNQ